MSEPFALYWQALTHRSWAEENGGAWNERLEWLGDAVLQLYISEMLYEAWPDEPEGDLTKRRQALVQNTVLAEIATKLDLGSIARLGRGERLSDGARREKFLADLVEALLGAILLDQGAETARAVVRSLWGRRLRRARPVAVNPKQALQERVQRSHGIVPRYIDLGSEGPAHEMVFRVKIRLGDEDLAEGSGSSKKEAQRAAAAAALRKLTRKSR